MKITIRPMQPIDLDQVYAIETTVHIAPWSRDIISDCVLVGYDCRVLEIDQGIAPVIVGYIISRQAVYEYHILNLCIAKDYQGKGLGRILLQKIINSLDKDMQVDFLILEVRPSNIAALKLYQSMGFLQVEIKKDYYKDVDSTEDAILLKKRIN